MIRSALGWLGWHMATALAVCVASASAVQAQGSFLIYAPPGQYSEDPTGLEFPQVFFDKHWDPPVIASLGFGGVMPQSGFFDKAVDSGFATRLQMHHPTLRRPTELGDLYLGWTGGFEYATYDGKDDNRSFATNPAIRPPFRVESLDTAMFGIGPDVNFVLGPLTDEGPELFFGTSFEGVVGWVGGDVSDVAPGAPAESLFRISGTDPNVGTDNMWGYRAGLRAGLAWNSGWAISSSVSTTRIRTEAITDIQDNSDVTTWMIHIEANTRAVGSQLGALLDN